MDCVVFEALMGLVDIFHSLDLLDHCDTGEIRSTSTVSEQECI